MDARFCVCLSLFSTIECLTVSKNFSLCHFSCKAFCYLSGRWETSKKKVNEMVFCVGITCMAVIHIYSNTCFLYIYISFTEYKSI